MDTVPCNINELISIVMISNYTVAFNIMQSYFLYITNKDLYKDELDILTTWLYKTYSIYNNKTALVLDSIKSPELIDLINLAQIQYINLSEVSDNTEYNKCLTDAEYNLLSIVYGDSYIDKFNVIIGSVKYNALYHRIKDYFIPLMYK